MESSYASNKDPNSSRVTDIGASIEQKELSLVEIAELIQNNQPIPGVIPIDVQPTNSEPTPSVLTRRLKPWECSPDLASDEAQDEVEKPNQRVKPSCDDEQILVSEPKDTQKTSESDNLLQISSLNIS